MTREDLIIEELESTLDRLYKFCIKNGYVPQHKKFSAILPILEKMFVLNPTKELFNVNTDPMGYIDSIKRVNIITDVTTPRPVDVEDGYYKLVGTEIVFDQKRKDELFPDVDRF